MGTRGIYGFRKNDSDKLTYNHYDSYPEGLGRDVAEFINKHSIEDLNKIYDRIILVDENSAPTKEQVEECKQWENLSVSKQDEQDWYCLLREAQGDLFAFDKGLRYMIDSHNFILDSLWCEYGYIINLDTNRLEIYVGFQKSKDETNRYVVENETEYYPCKMVAEIDLQLIQGLDNLDDLVANMVEYCEGNKDEDEDEDLPF